MIPPMFSTRRSIWLFVMVAVAAVVPTIIHALATPTSRRDAILQAAAAGTFVTSTLAGGSNNVAVADENVGTTLTPLLDEARQTYIQRFPTLFAPLYGQANGKLSVKRSVGNNVWVIEQNLELGPLQVPIRCVVIRLKDGTLWVHNPLAPTPEFFELVESCAIAEAGDGESTRDRRNNVVAHVVVSTYALEHKVFAKDALERWPSAQLWTSPGQFSFPLANAPAQYIWGRDHVTGILGESNDSPQTLQPSWIDEIEYETLAAGTFPIGFHQVTFYETAFYHKATKSLIVTDALIRVPSTPPNERLNDPDKLLLISKRSTSDPQPEDTPEARRIGWEKTCLLVSYFFPEHEELDPDQGPGVVTWTEGWHANFLALSNRLLVPPVVRELIYAKNPASVQTWVDRVANRWDFASILPAHFEAPIPATPTVFRRAFRFLQDPTIDAFPAKDLERGIQPIANLAVGKKTTK